MITLPTYYVEGRDQVIYPYYGRLLVDIVQRNRCDGLYGLTGKMLDEALAQWGARLGDDTIIFDSEGHKTLFIIRWS